MRRLAILALIALVACGGDGGKKAASGPSTTTPTTSPTTTAASRASTSAASQSLAVPPTGSYDHVLWVWMENHSYGQVIGTPAAPYETSLVHQFGTATHYASVGRPSLPNYIGATSGSTQGITDDASPSTHPLSADNLFRQVRASGRIERSYEETMPTNCVLSTVDAYAVKHNPAAYYTGGDDRAACRSDDVPFTATLPPGPLATFTFVTPNLCHDTHDCSVAIGDAWLKTFLPPVLATPEYRQGHLAIFVMWDESTPMPNIVISPTTPKGTMVAQPLDHYALLRTTEEILGLPLLGKAASATSMRANFGL
jgi:hypothetical protein